MIETNVKKFWKKINWFRRYSILNCLYVCLVTKWRKIQKSKLNNSPTDWIFEKNFSHLFLSRHVLSKLFICFAIPWNFNFAVNLVTSFSRQKPLKSKNKKHRIFWNTDFYHPAKFELKRIKNAKVVPTCCVMTWMIAHFILGIQNDATVNLLHAECMYTKQTTTATNFKAFPWYFQRIKSDRSLTLLLGANRTNACSSWSHRLN